jgi:hypothetical protein
MLLLPIIFNQDYIAMIDIQFTINIFT